MTSERARRAAEDYLGKALGRTIYYLDSVPTDEEWVVRLVLVEQRPRAGGGDPKRWNVLYEVHLDHGFTPLYHVRRGYWDKPLPNLRPEPEPGEEQFENGTEPRLRAGVASPRAGDDAGAADLAAAEGVEGQPDSAQAHAAETDGSGGVGVRAEGVAGEEAAPVVSEPEYIAEEKEPEVPVEPVEDEVPAEEAEPGGLTEEPAEGGAGEPAVVAVEEPLPEAAPEATAPTGPARPSAQERQGPPKVSFQYVSDEAVREPGGGC